MTQQFRPIRTENPWEVYEQRKREIAANCSESDHYDKEILELLDELGL